MEEFFVFNTWDFHFSAFEDFYMNFMEVVIIEDAHDDDDAVIECTFLAVFFGGHDIFFAEADINFSDVVENLVVINMYDDIFEVIWFLVAHMDDTFIIFFGVRVKPELFFDETFDGLVVVVNSERPEHGFEVEECVDINDVSFGGNIE